jgi:hypothetical protein
MFPLDFYDILRGLLEKIRGTYYEENFSIRRKQQQKIDQ